MIAVDQYAEMVTCSPQTVCVFSRVAHTKLLHQKSLVHRFRAFMRHFNAKQNTEIQADLHATELITLKVNVVSES